MNGWYKRGTQQPAAKLDDDKVREIRRRYIRGSVTLAAVSAEFGVSQTVISQVVNRKRWAHVE